MKQFLLVIIEFSFELWKLSLWLRGQPKLL